MTPSHRQPDEGRPDPERKQRLRLAIEELLASRPETAHLSVMQRMLLARDIVREVDRNSAVAREITSK